MRTLSNNIVSSKIDDRKFRGVGVPRTRDYKYIRFENNEKEFYNLAADPIEIHSKPEKLDDATRRCDPRLLGATAQRPAQVSAHRLPGGGERPAVPASRQFSGRRNAVRGARSS
jgi:hypothetical protein